MNVKNIWSLPIVDDIKNEVWLSEDGLKTVNDAKETICNILEWKDPRIIQLIWPCSIDNIPVAFNYAESVVAPLIDMYKDEIFFVMRFYTWKPRTTVWWKWISHAAPWKWPDIYEWILTVRNAAKKIIEEYNVPIADEMLNAHLASYFEDINSYLAVWARSTENQYHREIASWLSLPIWLKNPTSWDIAIMINSIIASQYPQVYPLIVWNRSESDDNSNKKSNCLDTKYINIVESAWNKFAHWILRWWSKNNVCYPNFTKEDLVQLFMLFDNKNIVNPGFIVDTNHDNSSKDYTQQEWIMNSVFNNLHDLDKVLKCWKTHILDLFKWFMTESYMEDWNEKTRGTKMPWLSKTDACIWKEKTFKYTQTLSENYKEFLQKRKVEHADKLNK